MIIVVNHLILNEYEINIRGAIFCMVNNNRQLPQLNPSMTLGNHQWKGAAPPFNNNGILTNIPIK